MKSVLIVLILAATAALGAVNLRRLRREGAPDPVLGAIHPLLGIGGLVVLLFSAASSSRAGAFGFVAGGLLAAAALCAVLSAILRDGHDRTADVLLATHAVCGIAGFLTALGWALR